MSRRAYPVSASRILPPTQTDVHFHGYCLSSLIGLIPHLATSLLPAHLGLILIAVPAAQAQEHALLSGFVRNATSEEPLMGANVFVEGTSFGAATDDNGSYSIGRIPPRARPS